MTIKKIISIASAKGGVGKSSITALLAMNFAKDFKVGILDADIYGPNQHILFDVENKKPKYIKDNDTTLMEPVESMGVKLNSMGFILDDDRAAIWRGPMLSGAITTPNKLAIHDALKSISFFNKLDINLLGYIENNTSNQVFNSADESLVIKNQTCIGKIIYSEDIYNLNIKKSMNLVSDISRAIQSLV